MTVTLELTVDEKLQIKQAAVRLQRRYEGEFNAETIERFITDTTDILMLRATTTKWMPILIERFTNDRLRALLRIDADPTTLNPSVLFLCVHNAGRSQMAAGWMRHLSDGKVDVFSGGSEPSESVNRAAVEAMAEVGVDISQELPQPWADEIVRAADVVVTMGCGDACPVYPGKRYMDWEVTDPSGKTIEEVRPIRDEIKARVENLLAEVAG